MENRKNQITKELEFQKCYGITPQDLIIKEIENTPTAVNTALKSGAVTIASVSAYGWITEAQPLDRDLYIHGFREAWRNNYERGLLDGFRSPSAFNEARRKTAKEGAPLYALYFKDKTALLSRVEQIAKKKQDRAEFHAWQKGKAHELSIQKDTLKARARKLKRERDIKGFRVTYENTLKIALESKAQALSKNWRANAKTIQKIADLMDTIEWTISNKNSWYTSQELTDKANELLNTKGEANQ